MSDTPSGGAAAACAGADDAPGRSCPLHYRYDPADLADADALETPTLYVVGGLYGNGPALERVLEMAASEPGGATAVFNGDFNWFNVDLPGFTTLNRLVLQHAALRGNVETELAGEESGAGCGCAYPDWVGDAEVERSNAILVRLRDTARAVPAVRAQLAALPMTCVARVGNTRVAIAHGDAESLAGWGFSQEALGEPAHRERAARWLDAARADVFACSHTCLPVACALSGGGIVVNNGAAGMPNFRGTRYGIVTRIALRPARSALYRLRCGSTVVEAVPLPYDENRFLREFLANWPAGSPAHESYLRRIEDGPDYRIDRALRPLKAPGPASAS